VKHYHKLFNRHDVSPNFSVIDRLKPLCIEQETKERVASLPSGDEVMEAIERMKPGMALGSTIVTSAMIKALPVDAPFYIAGTIRKNWKE
jgi:hypothetical protein